ncbi:MAG: hypothetical protein DMD65_09670 [Gemmatimonadetes bacterium]|nr:MAG: hypothetical protein DMD65_09670 [Gemmatimonadota bacterium]
MRYLADVLSPNVDVLYSNRHNLLEQLRKADLVIGAVLLPGAKAPKLVRRDDLKLMKPGSVIVDALAADDVASVAGEFFAPERQRVIWLGPTTG